MKYMGSKRAMLQNGLGHLIREKSKEAKRFVDLFCGSAAVAWFAAEKTTCPVLAVDLQTFSKILASAVIQRTEIANCDKIGRKWLSTAFQTWAANDVWFDTFTLDHSDFTIRQLSKKARLLSGQVQTPIMRAYGGHYFSPTQAVALDTLREHLPMDEPHRSICLAALIATASKCAASPGHTAQPFTPSDTSERSIREAWKRDPFAIAYRELKDICLRAAKKKGEAKVGDAVSIAATLNRHDLVFVDPPYSGVQYSRFYHVLETLALGESISVSGVGRYPPRDHRPQSPFSNKGESAGAVTQLLEGLSHSGCTVLFTFPNAECSNGLSGKQIREVAEEHFIVTSKVVPGRFSTLGGNNLSRKARLKSEELILILKPKSSKAKLLRRKA